MSNVLIEKLKRIKNEKLEKLIPENIAKDVTILGITGTFEGGNMTEDEYNYALERVDLLLGENKEEGGNE